MAAGVSSGWNSLSWANSAQMIRAFLLASPTAAIFLLRRTLSFLPPDSFRKVITDAGFEIDAWVDLTDLAREVFSVMNEPVGKPDLPALRTHLLVGSDILIKVYNLRRNLDEERVSLIETITAKPH